MRVAVISLDTRGGIQPYVALSLGLKQAGHDVRMVAPADFKLMIEHRGLKVFTTTGNMEETLRTLSAGAAEKGRLASMRYAKQETTLRISGWTREILAACELAGGNAGGGIVGGLGLYSSVSFRVAPHVALGVVGDAQLWFQNGLVSLATVAPAIRLGDGNHVTFALGPSLLISTLNESPEVWPMATALLHSGFPIHRAFGIHPQLSLSVGRDYGVLSLGCGFGGSVF